MTTRTVYTWRRLGGWIWLIGLAVLPLTTDFLRIESYESPRATLSIALSIGIILCGLAVWRTIPPENKRAFLRHPLTLATVVWAVSIVLSALLSLSPSRSVWGDVQRRMGALTQLSLLAAFVGGGLLTRRQLRQSWHVIGLVSFFVIGYALFQSGTRSASTLGVATFAASWAVIAILWLGIALINVKTRTAAILYALMIAALLAFLVITQTRGAVLGLFAGLVTLSLVWMLTHKRWLIGLILLSTLGIGAGVGTGIYLGFIKIDSHSSLARLPLIARLDSSQDDSSKFRLALWSSVLKIVEQWPTMTSLTGKADSLSALRPLVGYGQEMFQAVELPYISADLRTKFPTYQFLDRAHNLWLDTLVTQGFFGLLSLLAVLLAAVWTCIRVLRQQQDNWGERGWIAAGVLAIIVAHVVDLQFSFPSVASEWPFWASLGLLCAAAYRPISDQPLRTISLNRQSQILSVLMSGLLAWPLASQSGAAFKAVVLLTVGTFIFTRNWRTTLLAAMVSTAAIFIQSALNGALNSYPVSANAISALLIADHIAIYLGIALSIVLGRRWLGTDLRIIWFAVLVMSIVGIWWVTDASADAMFYVGGNHPGTIQTELYHAAIQIKTPDDRLNALVASVMLPADHDSGCYYVKSGLTINPYLEDLSPLIKQCGM